MLVQTNICSLHLAYSDPSLLMRPSWRMVVRSHSMFAARTSRELHVHFAKLGCNLRRSYTLMIILIFPVPVLLCEGGHTVVGTTRGRIR